jgi:hypothetical protein
MIPTKTLDVRTIRIPMTDSWVESAIGTLPDKPYFDPPVISGEAVDVLKPDGTLLLALRPHSLAWAACKMAYPVLLRAARPTTKRRVAAGGQEPFHSGTIGFLHGEMTFATRDNLKGYRLMWPLLNNIAQVFAEHCPDQYRLLREAAAQTPSEWLIPGTPFTSAAVNRNARMAVHKDDGNLPGAYGAMTVIRAGNYTGGLLVFPKYRVAVDLHNGDCLIADNQEAHGNTAIEGEEGFERVSVVCYYHASNLPE